MRKYLVAAVAAIATMAAGAGIASAQTNTGKLTVAVAPTKAGTKRKPANSSVHLVIDNDNTRAVLSKLVVHMPKTLSVSGKGFPACSKAKLDKTTLDSKGRPKVCAGSRVGGGTAQAQGGVNTASPFPVTFKITALVAGKNSLYFYLHGTNIAVNVVSPGKVKQTSKGPVLTVSVPQEAQQTGPLANGLVQLNTTLKGSKGSHKLIASTGCKSHKQRFSTDLTFARTFAPDGTLDDTGQPHYAQGPGYHLNGLKASSRCK